MPRREHRPFSVWAAESCGPYWLLPSEVENNKPQPNIGKIRLIDLDNWPSPNSFEILEDWPVTVVFENLAVIAAGHRLAQDDKVRQRRQATRKEIEEWVSLTRGLAERFPFGGPSRQRMRETAERVEANLNAPRRYFRHVDERREFGDFRLSEALWGMEQLRRAINDTEKWWAQRRTKRDGIKRHPW